MKKFMIITSPEYESFIALALIKVRGSDFERMKIVAGKKVDYSVLRFIFNDSYRSLLKSETFEQSGSIPSKAELRELGDNPEKAVNEIIERLEDGRERLERARIKFEEVKAKLIDTRARLEALRALKPEELKRCLAVGIIRFTKITDLGFTEWPRLEEHLLKFKDISFRMIEISPEEGFLFVFGPDERRAWVEALFLVFDVKSIFDVLSVRDILLALDIKKREEVLKDYEDEIHTLQIFIESEREIRRIKDELAPTVGKAEAIDQFLKVLSNKEVPIIRTKLVSVLVGRVPTDKVPQLKQVISGVEEKIGESLLVQYEDLPHPK